MYLPHSPSNLILTLPDGLNRWNGLDPNELTEHDRSIVWVKLSWRVQLAIPIYLRVRRDHNPPARLSLSDLAALAAAYRGVRSSSPPHVLSLYLYHLFRLCRSSHLTCCRRWLLHAVSATSTAWTRLRLPLWSFDHPSPLEAEVSSSWKHYTR